MNALKIKKKKNKRGLMEGREGYASRLPCNTKAVEEVEALRDMLL